MDEKPQDALVWPLRLAAAGLISGICFSLPLWIYTNRTFPPAGLISCPLSPAIDQVLTGLVLACCIGILLNKLKPLSTIILFPAVSGLILLDLLRFQPWVYEYAIIIFLCSLPENLCKSADDRSKNQLRSIPLLIIAIYFFSGLQKFNWRFFTVVGPWLLGASQCLQNSYENNSSLIFASATLPFSELLLAILLFCKRTRIFGMWFGILMHLYLLYMIGPWKLNTNPGVWPWNVVAIFLLTSLFRNRSDDLFDRLNFKQRPLSTLTLVIVCLVVPILGLFQITDPFPSFALYAGDVPYGKIMFEKSTLAKFTPILQKDYSYYDDRTGLWYVDINDWVYEESGASAYPSKLCFRLIAKGFARSHPGELVVLKLYTYPKLTKSVQTKFERLGEGNSSHRP